LLNTYYPRIRALASGPDETELRALIEQELRAARVRLGGAAHVRLSFDLGPDETELRALIEQELRAARVRLGGAAHVRLSFDLGPVEP
jgi:hypothetical protein